LSSLLHSSEGEAHMSAWGVCPASSHIHRRERLLSPCGTPHPPGCRHPRRCAGGLLWPAMPTRPRLSFLVESESVESVCGVGTGRIPLAEESRRQPCVLPQSANVRTIDFIGIV
jgi:hypothetical protein